MIKQDHIYICKPEPENPFHKPHWVKVIRVTPNSFGENWVLYKHIWRDKSDDPWIIGPIESHESEEGFCNRYVLYSKEDKVQMPNATCPISQLEV